MYIQEVFSATEKCNNISLESPVEGQDGKNNSHAGGSG